MATLTLDENQATFQIRGYQPGKIQINELFFTQSLIITPDQLITDWPPSEATDLAPPHFDIILPLKPDILLIGTGAKHLLLSPALYGTLINHGIGVEVMETAAACRTFNALTAENRRVAAALLLK